MPRGQASSPNPAAWRVEIASVWRLRGLHCWSAPWTAPWRRRLSMLIHTTRDESVPTLCVLN